MHAIVLMSTFHSLSGLIFGCDVTNENSLSVSHLTCQSIEENENEEETPFLCSNNLPLLSYSENNYSNKYIGHKQMKHEDFDYESKSYSTFHNCEYSWKDQGYGLLSQFYSGSALLLDNLFSLLFSIQPSPYVFCVKYFNLMKKLTLNQRSENGLITEQFKEAVWNYVHRILGIIHDDYDYHNVNILLSRHLKSFIKKAVCKPEGIIRKDFIKMGETFSSKEKCFITLLAMEAKKQAELIYGLRSIMNFQLNL